MGKNKLQKFAEMETLPNVFQCPAKELENDFKLKGKWHEYFGNSNPIVLELGCGKGVPYHRGCSHRKSGYDTACRHSMRSR